MCQPPPDIRPRVVGDSNTVRARKQYEYRQAVGLHLASRSRHLPLTTERYEAYTKTMPASKITSISGSGTRQNGDGSDGSCGLSSSSSKRRGGGSTLKRGPAVSPKSQRRGGAIRGRVPARTRRGRGGIDQRQNVTASRRVAVTAWSHQSRYRPEMEWGKMWSTCPWPSDGRDRSATDVSVAADTSWLTAITK